MTKCNSGLPSSLRDAANHRPMHKLSYAGYIVICKYAHGIIPR